MLPSLKGHNGLLETVINDWQLGGIFQASTGAPFTVLVGGDPLGLNNTDPFDYPDRLQGSGCGHAVNPRNPNNYIKLGCFAVRGPSTALKFWSQSTDWTGTLRAGCFLLQELSPS
jgi:hypothetical protein